MDSRPNIIDQATLSVATRALARSKKVKWIGGTLLVLGTFLLFEGFSRGGAIEISFGFLFLLYGLFRLFYIRRTESTVLELQAKIARLKEKERDGTL